MKFKWSRRPALAFLLIIAAPAGFPAAAETTAPAYRPSAAVPVETISFDWRDAKRDRAVPVKIYFPKTAAGRFPVIVFSHGLGGSRTSYEYLGRYWAGHGYVAVHLQHLGSDSAVWQDGGMKDALANMRRAAANLANATNRPLDVSFAIDQLEKLNRAESPLHDRLELSRIGMAGHSFGAFTTLAIAGEVFVTPGGGEISFADPRVKAAVAMSSPVPARRATLDQAFGRIQIPCLHLTGTEDFSPIGETRPEERRVPYDHIRGADQVLVIFRGANHMTFSGVARPAAHETEEVFKKLICESSTAFWDAYLKNDVAAKTWLTGAGFKTELGAEGTVEEKLPLTESAR